MKKVNNIHWDKKAWLLSLVLMLSGLFSQNIFALQFPLPAAGDDVVGQTQTISSQVNDTLISIGQRYNIGGYEMIQANPDLKRGKLKPGTQVLIPSQFILPSIRKGLVVNLAELRVYYFPENENVVVTFPIGAGRQGWNTPRTAGTVVRKAKDPIWTPPPSIRAESARAGKILPAFYPPGPDNPLGKYAVYLSIPGIRLHGTNAPNTVGMRSSHGCLRMLAPDIEYLFNNIPVGTPVQIIYEQDKIGWLGGHLYLESEVPFAEFDDTKNLKTRITEVADTQSKSSKVNWGQVEDVSDTRLGIPKIVDGSSE